MPFNNLNPTSMAQQLTVYSFKEHHRLLCYLIFEEYLYNHAYLPNLIDWTSDMSPVTTKRNQ